MKIFKYQGSFRWLWFCFYGGIIGLSGCLLIWLGGVTQTLQSSAQAPVGAYLVLGGSIRREFHVANLVKLHPEIPVIISQGSQDPCIVLIFRRSPAPLDRVWLEKCARSTFGNLYYSQPILSQWGVRKVKVITSATHLPRAQWLAQMILGSHGIWVEMDIASETGIPANRESWVKTSIDLVRGATWAIASQFDQPSCSQVIPLSQVNLAEWQEHGFTCEHQGHLQ